MVVAWSGVAVVAMVLLLWWTMGVAVVDVALPGVAVVTMVLPGVAVVDHGVAVVTMVLLW